MNVRRNIVIDKRLEDAIYFAGKSTIIRVHSEKAP